MFYVRVKRERLKFMLVVFTLITTFLYQNITWAKGNGYLKNDTSKAFKDFEKYFKKKKIVIPINAQWELFGILENVSQSREQIVGETDVKLRMALIKSRLSLLDDAYEEYFEVQKQYFTIDESTSCFAIVIILKGKDGTKKHKLVIFYNTSTPPVKFLKSMHNKWTEDDDKYVKQRGFWISDFNISTQRLTHFWDKIPGVKYVISSYLMRRRLKNIGNKLISNLPLADKRKIGKRFLFKIIKKRRINGHLERRRILITKGAMDVFSDDELAVLIGHELAHRLFDKYDKIRENQSDTIRSWEKTRREYVCDLLGAQYAILAGHNGMRGFIEQQLKIIREDEIFGASSSMVHPPSYRRIINFIERFGMLDLNFLKQGKIESVRLETVAKVVASQDFFNDNAVFDKAHRSRLNELTGAIKRQSWLNDLFKEFGVFEDEKVGILNRAGQIFSEQTIEQDIPYGREVFSSSV